MAYWVNGVEVRESTKLADEAKARRVLRRRIADVLRGEAIAHENRVTLADLCTMLTTDYETNGRRSLTTIPFALRHLRDLLGEKTKAITLTTDRLQRYVKERQQEKAAVATINIELALLGRAFTLAVRARRLQTKPYMPMLDTDPSRVRRGFFSRTEVERLAPHLPSAVADIVLFLFFSAWRVGEARTLQWRDYDQSEGAIRLRSEHSKNKHPRVLPVEGELATIIARRLEARRLDCPYIFHRGGKPIGHFRKVWARACKAIGLDGRIVHDLRRSGVRHLIRAGVAPHTVMAMSGHRTASMLKRYDIISLEDLQQAARRGSAYGGQPGAVTPLKTANP